MSQPRKPHTISGNSFNDDLAYKIDANFDAIFQQNIVNQDGVVPVNKGGTNLSSYTKGDLLYADTTTSIAGLHDIATGNVLLSGGVNTAPAYGKVSLSGTPIHVTGTLGADHGGTGIASYAVGDLLYASAATTLSKLADVATGNALISGGVTTAPSWGKIGLTTHISGVLPVANGGTNISSYSQGDLIYASGTTTLVSLAKNTTATRYLSNTGSSNNPAWAQVDLTDGVTGTLPVTSGGTGLATFTQGDLIYASASNTLSALAKNTSSTRYLSNQGSSNNPSWSLVSLTDGITGTLGPGNGGTGIAGIAQGDLIYGSGINTFAVLIKSASATRYLSNTGTSNNPAWAQVDLSNGVTGTLAIANGGTNASSASSARSNLGLGTIATQDASAVAITGGTITALLRFGGVLAPASFSTDRTDYAPTNWDTNTRIELNNSGAGAVNFNSWGTGTPTAGAIVVFVNVGTGNIVFKHASGTGTAALTFLLRSGTDFTMAAFTGGLAFYYESGLPRWVEF